MVSFHPLNDHYMFILPQEQKSKYGLEWKVEFEQAQASVSGNHIELVHGIMVYAIKQK
jgi:hypothetical protein